MTFDEKIQALATLIETETLNRLHRDGITYSGHDENAKVEIKPGKKYTRLDVGRSGKYMVTADGEIYGIKAYGVLHRGHRYGTLDTIADWYWGGYVAVPRGDT